jgi:hypothetical protein
VLKNVARRALPVLGGMAGTFLGGPAGGALGSNLASTAGRMFGLELEGLSHEDREFEVARRFIRFANATAQNLSQAPETTDPRAAVRQAVLSAARVYAPGLMPGLANGSAGASQGMGCGGGGFAASQAPASGIGHRIGLHSGRWIRRGNRIVLYGV